MKTKIDFNLKVNDPNLFNLYETMFLIRGFEERVLKLFSEGKIYGTTHTSIGQEAIAVASMNSVTTDDYVFSNHRCHGHYIAYGGDIRLFFAELMGKKTGLVGGRGGSQHIKYKNFFTNGVQGGIVGNATGIALSKKLSAEDGIVYCFLGDGTLGQGLVYESLNFSSLKSLPIMFIIENNQYAMSTNYIDSIAGSIRMRTESFGIQTLESNSNDVVELTTLFSEAKRIIKEDLKPVAVVVNTYRLAPHSKGDEIRTKEELDHFGQLDPIYQIKNSISKNDLDSILISVNKQIEEALYLVDNDDKSEIELVYTSDYVPKLIDGFNYNTQIPIAVTVRDRINYALDYLMNEDKKVFLIGEDLRDPYGGAFKVTKDLTKKHSDRIINTPISEAGITAWTVGAALNGSRPIAEIMFGDFITMSLDQLINHASKYMGVYRLERGLPFILRTPMGGKRGYGATHSQSLEKLLLGIPNIMVVAINNVLDPFDIYLNLNKLLLPKVIVENKLLYSKKMLHIDGEGNYDSFKITISKDYIPLITFTHDYSSAPLITIVAYGDMINDALDVASHFMIEHEILVNVVAVTQLSPFQTDSILKLTYNTKYLVTIEEGTADGNWGQTLISNLTIQNKDSIQFLSLSSKDHIIPIEKNFEDEVLLGKEEIINKLESLIL